MSLHEEFRLIWLHLKRSYQLRRTLSIDEQYELQALVMNERGLFAELVGDLAIAWGTVELALDLANQALIHHKGLQETQLPVSLKGKIGLFRRSFEVLPELAQFRDRALSIVSTMNRLKEVRHDVIHGYAIKRMPGGLREFERRLYSGKVLKRQTKTYALREISNATREILLLVRELAALAQDAILIIIDNQPDDSNG